MQLTQQEQYVCVGGVGWSWGGAGWGRVGWCGWGRMVWVGWGGVEWVGLGEGQVKWG